MDDGKKKPGKTGRMNLQLHIDDEIAQGVYANFAVVNHTPTEFMMDFVFMQPQQPRGKVLSRVVTSPVHAKRFMLALTENMKKYEQRFGEVKLPKAKPSEPVIH